MFKRVLIANRGAIAVRICRTLKKMGVESVAVYSDADRDSLHRVVADSALPLGDGPASATYLNQPLLLDLMLAHGIDAVHPGYGFLSENPEFAAACEAHGIAFIGPTPDQMTAFGLKHRARELARQAGVPLLEGSDLLANPDQAATAASLVGYPVMLKSTAGGGGIGMQICTHEDALRDAFASVQRMGANHFANDGVFLEKYIARARHIEVQIFGDGRGGALALGERDCSAQRRHQKVIEETPAPGLRAEVRHAMQETAVRLMQSVQYRNAGTVEFIYDQDSQQFWFLEVNTRLQVEHGVTEMVYGVDLVQWMLELAAGEIASVAQLPSPRAQGHAIQARLYAEDPQKGFSPCAGLLTLVEFPKPAEGLRLDTWIETGTDVPALYDPMLAKVVLHRASRAEAIAALDAALGETHIEGIETNRSYLQQVLRTPQFAAGEMTTRFLNNFSSSAATIDVLQAGTQTHIQDWPGRIGYWDVGVPPSGPFDDRSLRLANRLLGNPTHAPALEMTLNGASLRFNCNSRIAIVGADMQATLDSSPVDCSAAIAISAGQTLTLGKARQGARTYLAIAGGIKCSPYLGSCATFTLGRFGGHGGRALRAGDVLHIEATDLLSAAPTNLPVIDWQTDWSSVYRLRVIYGPHGAPDFFSPNDIRQLFTSAWEVHYNSSRTGIRLIGPKPEWARSDGGEAGMHPSNIHDNAYAIGAIDFTGDMPVILGPDGPSLGGFVCPATVIRADLWKLGQLKAGDRVQFVPVTLPQAQAVLVDNNNRIDAVEAFVENGSDFASGHSIDDLIAATPILGCIKGEGSGEDVVYRPAGDQHLLIEYGPLELDIGLRFRVHALMLKLQELAIPGVRELTPGIRSLQVHYDSLVLSTADLLEHLRNTEALLGCIDEQDLPSRVVYLPLSWDDEACQLAIQKYMQSVRKDAPWCPSNLEFIRRINGLENIDEVKRIVFDALYLVMGLGDVYLGAPVATPLDPRHRLVTTKYNPARTWTAENSVGIGGSYLCIYGMEGPGGYQFVGRTLQMWNRFHRTAEFSNPWLLRFFDQIRFYEVSADELRHIREEFPRGRYPLRIENTTFSLAEYKGYTAIHRKGIANFTKQREAAYAQELQRWIASGQINFSSEADAAIADLGELQPPEHVTLVESPVAGSIWKNLVAEGAQVEAGQALAIIESMKMEVVVSAPCNGTLSRSLVAEGQAVTAGKILHWLQPEAQP